jgi:hypothetical protein
MVATGKIINSPNDSQVMYRFFKLPLYSETGQPAWIENPHGPEVDIAALPILESTIPPEAFPTIPDAWINTPELSPGDDVFIVGFPGDPTDRSMGTFVDLNLPIWTNGKIAQDFGYFASRVGVPSRGSFLIDAGTRQGLSGSPVYHKSGNFMSFLGVYASRPNPQTIDGLGRVWRREELENIVRKGYRPKAP